MFLHILGSGDAFGSGGRAQTCILVEADNRRILVDCGATSLMTMPRAGIAPETIDHIVLTHLHGDHFGGIPLMLLRALHVARHPRGLTIVGPAGVQDRVLATLDLLFQGARASVEQAIVGRELAEFIEYAPGVPLLCGPATLTALPVRHSESTRCYGIRLQIAGKVFAYSGDTEWTPALVEMADGADLLLVECHAWDSAPAGHLSYSVIREHLPDLRAKRIVLTHMSEAMLRHTGDIDDARVQCAFDGLEVAV